MAAVAVCFPFLVGIKMASVTRLGKVFYLGLKCVGLWTCFLLSAINDWYVTGFEVVNE